MFGGSILQNWNFDNGSKKKVRGLRRRFKELKREFLNKRRVFLTHIKVN